MFDLSIIQYLLIFYWLIFMCLSDHLFLVFLLFWTVFYANEYLLYNFKSPLDVDSFFYIGYFFTYYFFGAYSFFLAAYYFFFGAYYFLTFGSYLFGAYSFFACFTGYYFFTYGTYSIYFCFGDLFLAFLPFGYYFLLPAFWITGAGFYSY